MITHKESSHFRADSGLLCSVLWYSGILSELWHQLGESGQGRHPELKYLCLGDTLTLQSG